MVAVGGIAEAPLAMEVVVVERPPRAVVATLIRATDVLGAGSEVITRMIAPRMRAVGGVAADAKGHHHARGHDPASQLVVAATAEAQAGTGIVLVIDLPREVCRATKLLSQETLPLNTQATSCCVSLS